MFNIPVFKCDWVDSNGGVKVDELGVTLVNLNRVGHKSDSFVLATQVKQVFFVPDQVDERWSIVQFTSDKYYKHVQRDDEVHNLLEHHPFSNNLPNIESLDAFEDDDYTREHCEGIWIENKMTESK